VNDFLIPNMDIQKYEYRIQQLRSRTGTGSFQELSNSQQFLYEAAYRASAGQPNVAIPRSSIEREFYILASPAAYDFNSRDNLITDFCYNMVNLEDNYNKFLVCTKAGFFQFKGISWLCPDGVTITWNVRRKFMTTVGKYRNGVYNWNFQEIETLISKNKENANKSDAA